MKKVNCPARIEECSRRSCDRVTAITCTSGLQYYRGKYNLINNASVCPKPEHSAFSRLVLGVYSSVAIPAWIIIIARVETLMSDAEPIQAEARFKLY